MHQHILEETRQDPSGLDQNNVNILTGMKRTPKIESLGEIEVNISRGSFQIHQRRAKKALPCRYWGFTQAITSQRSTHNYSEKHIRFFVTYVHSYVKVPRWLVGLQVILLKTHVKIIINKTEKFQIWSRLQIYGKVPNKQINYTQRLNSRPNTRVRGRQQKIFRSIEVGICMRLFWDRLR